jgi:segregation and condensation protein B
MDIATQIEATLFYRNEPVSFRELAQLLGVPQEEIVQGIEMLTARLANTALTVVQTDTHAQLATAPAASDLILQLRSEELTRDLGKAGAETLAIVLYNGPVLRSEIDFIRGVNSSFILRNLQIRGLVEKQNVSGRTIRYAPTVELLAFLGISDKKQLPEYERTVAAIAKFIETKNDAVSEGVPANQ